MGIEAGLKRILGGRFSYIVHQSTILLCMKPLYRNGNREWLFHIGTTHYSDPAGIALGTR